MKLSRRILLRRAAQQLALALLAVAGTMNAVGAIADSRVDPVGSTTVRFSDLDLSRPDASRILYDRIQVAARRVCKASITYLYLKTAPARQECYRLTVADAVRRTNLSVLTALHLDAEGSLSR